MWTSKVALNPLSPTNITRSGRAQPSPGIKYYGKQISQIARLKEQFVDEYKKVQAQMWPEVETQLKECNIEDYSIFHDPETHVLFATFKYVGHDWAGDMVRVLENDKVQEWRKITEGFQESFSPKASQQDDEPVTCWKTLKRVS